MSYTTCSAPSWEKFKHIWITNGIAFMKANHGIPSFTLNNLDPKMILKREFMVLGPTRTKRVMKLMGGMQSISCVLYLDSSYPTLCRNFINMISYVITLTWLVGSRRTPIMIFPLIRARIYKWEGSLLAFIAQSCEVKVIVGDPLTCYTDRMGRCMKESMFYVQQDVFSQKPPRV